jgi:DNA-binding NarL/FixJ family response regulator
VTALLRDKRAVERFARVVAVYCHPPLSPPPSARELEVAFLTVVEGFTEREIAEHLVVTLKTVDYHRYHFVKKSGLPHARDLWHRLAKDYWRAVGRDEMRGTA